MGLYWYILLPYMVILARRNRRFFQKYRGKIKRLMILIASHWVWIINNMLLMLKHHLLVLCSSEIVRKAGIDVLLSVTAIMPFKFIIFLHSLDVLILVLFWTDLLCATKRAFAFGMLHNVLRLGI